MKQILKMIIYAFLTVVAFDYFIVMVEILSNEINDFSKRLGI